MKFAIFSTCVLSALLLAVPASSQCTNACGSANDGECDDGGPNARYDICALGSDCNDCGPRFCDNTCATAGDGECDDGGPGSLYDVCALGTDCGDCGPR